MKLAYSEEGRAAPAFVFVHGWCCDRSFFAPQAAHFAGRHRVVSVDLRGHGQSDAPLLGVRELHTVAGHGWHSPKTNINPGVIAFDAISPPVYDSHMATLLIRNLDDIVAERLRAQARLKGVSVEEEARRIIAEGTTMTREEALKRIMEIRARQKPNKTRGVDLIREDRDR